MRSTVFLTALITAIILSGCAARENDVTVIGGADGPTAVFLATEEDMKEDKSPGTDEEEKSNVSEEFLAGTWASASQGYEYYGTPQAEYYVRFEGNDIIYGHMKDDEFTLDHTDTVSLIEQTDGGGYIIKARTESGAKYTYRSAESDMDMLNYYSTWDESEFSDHYHAGASLTRIHD